MQMEQRKKAVQRTFPKTRDKFLNNMFTLDLCEVDLDTVDSKAHRHNTRYTPHTHTHASWKKREYHGLLYIAQISAIFPHLASWSEQNMAAFQHN